ncbi:MAG: hypothetical protein ACI3V4_07470 [Faecousia sp.]
MLKKMQNDGIPFGTGHQLKDSSLMCQKIAGILVKMPIGKSEIASGSGGNLGFGGSLQPHRFWGGNAYSGE